MSQDTLSKKLGRSRTFIFKIEAGTRRVDVIELFLIAEALDVKPLALLAELSNRLQTL
jgi:transcriptional regulator with XRE-family HTH domain